MRELYSFNHNIMGVNYEINVDSLTIKKIILGMFKIELLNSHRISANLTIINSNETSMHVDSNSLIIKLDQEKLSIEKLRIYVIQMVTRHASYMNLLNNGDIFLLHGSSIGIGNKAVLFGDFFNNTGKTVGAISYLLKGLPLIEDEFTILDTRDMKLYGVAHMDTIHIKNATKDLFFNNLLNQAKNFYSPKDFNSKKVSGNILQTIVIITNQENKNMITDEMQFVILCHIILSNILKLIYPGFDRFDPIDRGNDVLEKNYSELINELIYKFGHIVKEKIDFCGIEFEYRTKKKIKDSLNETYFDIHIEGVDNVGKTSLINEIKHHVLKDTCTRTFTLKDYLFRNSANLEQVFFNRESRLIADDMFNAYSKLFNIDSDLKIRLFDRGYITAISAINSRNNTPQREFKIDKLPNIIISFQFSDLKEIQNIRKCKYDSEYLTYQENFINEYRNEMNEVINDMEYNIVVTNYCGVEKCIQNAIISMKKTHILITDVWRSVT